MTGFCFRTCDCSQKIHTKMKTNLTNKHQRRHKVASFPPDSFTWRRCPSCSCGCFRGRFGAGGLLRPSDSKSWSDREKILLTWYSEKVASSWMCDSWSELTAETNTKSALNDHDRDRWCPFFSESWHPRLAKAHRELQSTPTGRSCPSFLELARPRQPGYRPHIRAQFIAISHKTVSTLLACQSISTIKIITIDMRWLFCQVCAAQKFSHEHPAWIQRKYC